MKSGKVNITENNEETRSETWALAGLLTGRFGPLALSCAAGKAAAAERSGDLEMKEIWNSVITHLRLAIAAGET